MRGDCGSLQRVCYGKIKYGPRPQVLEVIAPVVGMKQAQVSGFPGATGRSPLPRHHRNLTAAYGSQAFLYQSIFLL